MSKTVRLPVQHPRAPHCASCNAQLPNLDDVIITIGKGFDVGECSILGFTFHIRCKCGAPWDLLKKVKR
jgi:hypothetical protein